GPRSRRPHPARDTRRRERRRRAPRRADQAPRSAIPKFLTLARSYNALAPLRMSQNSKKVICYLSAAAGDWGGASRVLFTNLRLIDRSRYEPLVLLPGDGPIIPLLNELGIRHAIWGKHHEPAGWVRDMRDVIRAARFFRRNGVDLLHINHANYWRPAEIVAARLLGIPVV